MELFFSKTIAAESEARFAKLALPGSRRLAMVLTGTVYHAQVRQGMVDGIATYTFDHQMRATLLLLGAESSGACAKNQPAGGQQGPETPGGCARPCQQPPEHADQATTKPCRAATTGIG